ncbi:MAG: hypothetical protein WCF04_09820, partial [Candidatus Nanopelagicales bacterium]
MIENGATAMEVMGLFGHAGLATTQRYPTTRHNHLRVAVAANPLLAHVTPGDTGPAGSRAGRLRRPHAAPPCGGGPVRP